MLRRISGPTSSRRWKCTSPTAALPTDSPKASRKSAPSWHGTSRTAPTTSTSFPMHSIEVLLGDGEILRPRGGVVDDRAGIVRGGDLGHPASHILTVRIELAGLQHRIEDA